MMFKIYKYKGFEIHYVTRGLWKYDIYMLHDDHKLYTTSVNTLKDAKQTVNDTIYVMKNIPF